MAPAERSVGKRRTDSRKATLSVIETPAADPIVTLRSTAAERRAAVRPSAPTPALSLVTSGETKGVKVAERVDLAHFARLTGPVPRVPPAGDAADARAVRYRGLHSRHGKRRLAVSVVLALVNVTIEVIFFWWYLQPRHFDGGGTDLLVAANVVVLATLGTIETLRLLNVISLSLASVIARDPIPLQPPKGLNVAFCTTYVPSSEPFAMLERTIRAARKVTYRGGSIQVWVLDEGDDPKVRKLCKRLSVMHFSRKDQPQWNRESGRFKQRTKHGNYNAWLEHLSGEGIEYDILMGVDTDHAPLPSYAMRLLGYFHDENVAFVVAPQFYGNSEDRLLVRGAESQQFPFHSLIQRAGNRYGSPMLVGTNLAMRMTALRSVGGFHDSITEDMTTGIALHSSRNPTTGKRWHSVYTPDLVAVGEGPSSWGEYFNQQMRWSRGTFQLLTGYFWKRMWRMTPGKILHYLLIMTFYPSMAIGWLFGILNVVLVLGVGATGLAVPIYTWVMFYALATCSQLSLYILHRDHNVSPFEDKESTGLVGMVMSVLAAPMYASALMATVFRRPLRFVVTPKGRHASGDRLMAFWRHGAWATVIAVAIAVAYVRGDAPTVAYAWPVLQLAICLTPPLCAYRSRRIDIAAARAAVVVSAESAPAAASAAVAVAG